MSVLASIAFCVAGCVAAIASPATQPGTGTTAFPPLLPMQVDPAAVDNGLRDAALTQLEENASRIRSLSYDFTFTRRAEHYANFAKWETQRSGHIVQAGQAILRTAHTESRGFDAAGIQVHKIVYDTTVLLTEDTTFFWEDTHSSPNAVKVADLRQNGAPYETDSELRARAWGAGSDLVLSQMRGGESSTLAAFAKQIDAHEFLLATDAKLDDERSGTALRRMTRNNAGEHWRAFSDWFVDPSRGGAVVAVRSFSGGKLVQDTKFDVERFAVSDSSHKDADVWVWVSSLACRYPDTKGIFSNPPSIHETTETRLSNIHLNEQVPASTFAVESLTLPPDLLIRRSMVGKPEELLVLRDGELLDANMVRQLDNLKKAKG